MFFSLDLQRARKGDCFILHYGSNNEPGLALIDGGPSGVYKPYLKPRLKQIRKNRGLGSDESLAVDLLMVSHIDDDHIKGILELTDELVNEKDSGQPRLLKVKSFWHNTFDDIIGNKPDELLSAVTALFGTAALSGEPDPEGLDPDVAMVLAGVKQGFRLRDDVRKLGYRINPEFNGKLIMISKDNERIDMGKGLKLTVAGPAKDELVKLQRDHDAFLRIHEDDKKKEEALASLTDNSVANLSSLVLLCEVKKKRILLTGDARGDKILEGLELAALIKKNSTMHVDILKMPHHGSDRNVDENFFRRITADHYVFSGNGEHGNPERSTLQMLLDERGDEEFTIHLTYPVAEIDAEREKDWNKEQKKEKNKKKKKPGTGVREDWSHDKHSLSAFFKEHEDFAKKVSIVAEDGPHVIDLLDKIGF